MDRLPVLSRLEAYADDNEPLIPLVEEAIGNGEIDFGIQRKVHAALIPAAMTLCTIPEVRDAGTASVVRVYCSPEVPYTQRYGTSYSLRVVITGRRLANSDGNNVSTIEIELGQQKGDEPKSYQSIAAMSPSTLTALDEKRSYNSYPDIGDLQSFLETFDYIQAQVTGTVAQEAT